MPRGLEASFFEVTTAVAFPGPSARTPADACIVEVGLGGRLDATNVLTQLRWHLRNRHHWAWIMKAFSSLAEEDGIPDMPPLDRIAFEKAGIAKAGDAPLLTQKYSASMANIPLPRTSHFAQRKCCTRWRAAKHGMRP